MSKQSKIPVTVVTGFLGAGKTTLINNLLQKYAGTQFALVENEFGEVAIDTKLIKGVDTSQLFELKQGCICCTISDEYELVLQELAERFPEVDHLLIETTGVADPAPVIQPFFRDKELKELYEFNGTICLVDALNFGKQHHETVSLKQLAVADLVLVNKSESLSEIHREQLQKRMKKLSPFARIDFISYGNSSQLELGDFQTKKHSEFDFLNVSSTPHGISTKTTVFQRPLNRKEFLRWLDYTLDVYKNQVYRCKGLLYFQGEPFEYILQGVGGNYEIIEGDLILEEPKSKLVFIGKLDNVSLDFV